MAANLNIMKRVGLGELTVPQAKDLLKSVCGGKQAEDTSTWKRLCRLEAALVYFRT